MDCIGKKYNHLTIIGYEKKDSRGKTRVFCECECGNIKSYDMYTVKAGSTKSCGCVSALAVKNRMTTHGMSKTRLFRTWVSMRRRCISVTSKEYKHYGGRGISVCEDWNTFEPFFKWASLNGYQDNLTIERVDVNGNYCPDNCTWIERALQQKNKRSNVIIKYNGETKILKDWCTELNIDYKTASGRLKSGWDIERTFSNNYGIPFNRKVRKN